MIKQTTRRRKTEKVFVWLDDDIAGPVIEKAETDYEGNKSAALRYYARRGIQLERQQARDPVPFEPQPREG